MIILHSEKKPTQLRLVSSAEVLITTCPFYSILTFLYCSEHVYPKAIYRALNVYQRLAMGYRGLKKHRKILSSRVLAQLGTVSRWLLLSPVHREENLLHLEDVLLRGCPSKSQAV